MQMQMSRECNLQGEVGLKTDAQTFYSMWTGKTRHNLTKVCPAKVQACVGHKGEYGQPGAVIEWHYAFDGKQKKTKQITEVDDEKKKIVHKFIEGDYCEEFKDFKITIEIAPNARTEGSVIRWTFTYKKVHESIPDPNSLLEFLMGFSKDVDNYLLAA